MGNCAKGCRISLHFFACIILVSAVALAIVALATPKWQEVVVSGSLHQHGLWRDCVTRLDSDNNPTDWICEYRGEAEDDNHNHGNQQIGHAHLIEHWRMTTIILLIVSIFPFGFLGVIFGCISACTDCCSYNRCLKGLSVVWTVFSFIAAVLMSSACIVFFRHGYENDERKVQDGVNIYEQVFGWSYYLAIASAVAFVVATIFAAVATVLLCVMGSTPRNPKVMKTWPKYNVNSTSV